MPSSYSLLTVATVNYIAQAVTALQSAKRHNTFHSYHIFCPDSSSETLISLKRLLGEDASWINIFCIDDLGLERTAFLRSFQYYSKSEIANLSKFFGLSYLQNFFKDIDTCVFIDGDISFFGNIIDELEKEEIKSVMLTPHLTGPLDTVEAEHEIMIHGWMNAGCMIYNFKHPKTLEILEWLKNRILTHGFHAPFIGLNFDQTWVSALPILFKDYVTITSHKGINVAYWNIKQRILTKVDNIFYAAEQPLILFHFSGFNPKKPNYLSVHENILVSKETALSEAVLTYCNELKTNESLQRETSQLNAYNSNEFRIAHRLKVAKNIYGQSLYISMPEPGVFSKFGSKIDVLIRKSIALFYERK